MPTKWRRDSEFGNGRRVPLDREQRAQFRAKLHLARRPGRLTIAAAVIGRTLCDMLGATGHLDPSIATIAARAAVHPATVVRALAQLRALGFLQWTRRLVRAAETGWRVIQTSNAYRLCVPATDMHFAVEVISQKSKKASPAVSATDNAARQLRALGFPVPEWMQPV